MEKNKNCLYCKKKLTGSQRKFCSPNCNTLHIYHTKSKNNPVEMERRRLYDVSRKEHKLKDDKRRYNLNKPKRIEYSRNYYEENREKSMQTKKEYTMRRYHSDENFKMRIKLGTSLNYVIRRYLKTGRIMNPMAKYCIDWVEIIEHLKPFPKKRKDYHVDHIIPLCKFDLTNWEQIQIAFAPENHQWLKVKKNLAKGGRDLLSKDKE